MKTRIDQTFPNTAGTREFVRIAGHFEIIKDCAPVEHEFLHFFRNGFIGFLAFQQADGKASQAGDVFRPVAGADSAAVFIVVPVDDVMAAFHAPVFAVVAKDLLRARLIRGGTGDAIDDFLAQLAGFLINGFSLDLACFNTAMFAGAGVGEVG